MEKVKAPVRILTNTFKLLNEIDVYDSFRFIESYHGLGSFEWKIPVEAVKVDQLAQNNLVLFKGDNRLVGYIEYFEEVTDDNGREYYSVKGFPLKGITQQRFTIPETGAAVNKIRGTADEQMVHYLEDYVGENAINPLDSFPTVVIRPASGIGDESTYESRNKQLSSELESISTASGIGWQGYVDFSMNKIVLETFQGIDRSRQQEGNPKIIFSRELDNIKDSTYVRSNMEYKNVGYIAGEGEGEDRTVIVVGDTTARGWDRRVTFIDARDIQSDTAEDEEQVTDPEEVLEQLRQRGKEKMAEMKQIETFEVTPADIHNKEYRKDYDLGDIVTCESKKLNVRIDERITATEHVIDNNGHSITHTIGYDQPSLVKKIKQEIAKGQATGETVANSEIKGGGELARKAIATAGTAEKTAQQAAVDAQEAKQANEDAKAIALRAETTASAALNSAALSNETSNRALLTAQNKDRLRVLFVASEGQTVVPLPFEYTPGKYQLDVYLDKLHCISGTPSAELPTGLAADYIENDKKTITFTTPLKGGSIVEVILPE